MLYFNFKNLFLQTVVKTEVSLTVYLSQHWKTH